MEFVEHPNIAPGILEKRSYQTNMANGCLRKNSLVILPTGLGKTVIAVRVAAEYVDSGKVLVLAPTKPLVDQHSDFFRTMMPSFKTSTVNGNMRPDLRKKVIEESDVVVSTPQCISNDLQNECYDLSPFSLIIYDEAHRGTGNYAYVEVAHHRVPGTRSVGMTASPGSDMDRIEEVCRNLDLYRIDIRSDYDPDVSPYVHDTYINRIEVNLPDDLSDIVALLKVMLDRFNEELISLHLTTRDWPPSVKHMNQISRGLQARLAKGEKSGVLFRGMTLQSICIKILHALSLAETQGMTALRNYLNKLEEESKQKEGGKGAKEIASRPEFTAVMGIVAKTNVEHPKVSRVMSLVSRAISENPDSKVIVFAQYRDTCD
ncbi:MAG: DEAD/DEAH box helicase family protein, partial [Candidatus Methanomethylophilaceae archaeon]|nr:DEAD/DEAH box helicase family protein [Candidatus Methanomethylophilaceae archaeon]